MNDFLEKMLDGFAVEALVLCTALLVVGLAVGLKLLFTGHL